MKTEIIHQFKTKWLKYFNDSSLPFVVMFTNSKPEGKTVRLDQEKRCVCSTVYEAINGETLIFDEHSFGCLGGKRYAGFSDKLRPGFEYFLSCGIPGEIEGERYKKSPELVRDLLKERELLIARHRFMVFKPWEKLEESDEPLIVIFMASPDVLSALFTLANFEGAPLYNVIAPFGSGCSALIENPLRELESPQPRAVLGMFDISARAVVKSGELSFAIPYPKFEQMVNNMDESFLITASWEKVRTRL